MQHAELLVYADAPVAVNVGETPCTVGPGGLALRHNGRDWDVTA
jgi:hypothetical protein